MSLNNLDKKNLFELTRSNQKIASSGSKAKYEQLVDDEAPLSDRARSRLMTSSRSELEVNMQKECSNKSPTSINKPPSRNTLLSTSSKTTFNDDWHDAGSSLIRSRTASDNYEDDEDDEYDGNSGHEKESHRLQKRQDQQMYIHHPSIAEKQLNGSLAKQNGDASLTPVINRWFRERRALGQLNGKRTISQSMLEMDRIKSTAGFKVEWRDLSFSYKNWNRFSPEQKRRSKQQLANDDIEQQQRDPAVKSARSKRQKQQTLRNVSGEFSSNQFVALIGPSGCGKTTLLQFLAGNNPTNKDKIRIKGLDRPKVAFIGQDDCLINGLTPRETLMYASKFQHHDNSFDHATHIQVILDELGLADCADRSVTKLSGGQIKRVIIAQELLYPTNLLILDEVTSGLDASTSYSIIKLLKYLVSDKSYPMSIVISIHQPSARLFDVFDKVYVMSDGSCLYEGSCKVDTVNKYLSQFGLKCPKFHNIADYLIEIACEDSNDQIKLIKERMVECQTRQYDVISPGQIHKANLNKALERVVLKPDANRLDNARMTSSLTGLDGKIGSNNNNNSDDNIMMAAKKDINIFPDASSVVSSSSQPDNQIDNSLYESIEKTRDGRERPFWNHFVLHYHRSILRIRRSYILTYLQLFTYIILGLQLATFFGPDIGKLSGCPRLPSSLISFVLSGEVDEDLTQEMRRVQENMNFLLVAVMTSTFAALEVTVITFPLEAKSIKREWRNGWYRNSSYFLGRTLADLPFQIVYVLIFCLIIYTMTSQIGLLTWRFGAFFLCLIMTALVAQSFGFIFGAIFMNNLPAAVFTAPLCIFPTLLFSGFFSRVSQIPKLYTPFTYISHFRYAFDTLLVTLYGYERCYCDEDTLSSYHASMQNQTSSIKDIFLYLFGSNECNTTMDDSSSNMDESGVEDTTPMVPRDDFALEKLQEQTAKLYATTTPEPSSFSTTISSLISSTFAPNPTGFKTIEDALVDSVFEHMSNGNSTTSLAPSSLMDHSTTMLASSTTSGHTSGNGIDNLAHKFSSRIVTMLNKQSNFGHSLPEKCSEFNSFLLVEFDLQNNDLIIGLVMLLMSVLLTRIVCNIILNFTIATRK